MSKVEDVAKQIQECGEKQDFATAFQLVKDNRAELIKSMELGGIWESLKKATSDRLVLSFLDSVDLGATKLDAALVYVEKLLSFRQGSLVLNDTWGLGEVRRLDYFYRKITVDFKTRKGHQFTYAAAADMLESAPEGHILVLRKADPERVETMLREHKGEFVKAVLKSYGGALTPVKLEDICVANGFVKAVNWKAFWDEARAELRRDKLVKISAKKADPIELLASEETYGDSWLTSFSHETDPKLILSGVREYLAKNSRKALENGQVKAIVAERLAFAVTAARKVDDALFARLACEIADLELANPPADEMRAYLWDRKRYVKAAALLPAREVGAMIRFLAKDDEAKAQLYKALPEFCFTAVSEIVTQFKGDPACRQTIGSLMRQPTAPATLVTLIVGKIEQFGRFDYADVTVDGKKIKTLKQYALWAELPGFPTMLAHAVALGEGRRGGEILKMQNIVRRLFADKNWLQKAFSMLTRAEQVLFFERFQASIAWDPSTHHTIVVRMTNIVPELKEHLVKVEKKKEYARVTSFRSFAFKKAEYLKLINEDMPENVRKIEFAKGFGDLSENAEYQYAKDEQRALMQKQTLMQQDLEEVKPFDFAEVAVDEVAPGVMVRLAMPEGEKQYTILGEWDNDLDRNIISSKARLAQNLLGKKPGETFELPGTDGAAQFGKVLEILPLTDEVREWMKLPAGMQI